MPRKNQVRRLPNGYGTIRTLAGNRRKPYLAGVNPRLVLNEENGKSHYEYEWIGIFEDKGKAMAEIFKYHEDPYDIAAYNMTMQELYDKFCVEHFKNVSPGQAQSLKRAWAFCSDIYTKKVITTKVPQLRSCIQNARVTDKHNKTTEATDNIKNNIKSLLNLMYDYAYGELDIIPKNYARAFELSYNNEVKNPHIKFEDSEIETISKNLTMDCANMIYVGIYSGWRPDELCQLLISDVDLEAKTFKGGIKTRSSKNRIIPIHPKILPIVQSAYQEAKACGSTCLFTLNGKSIKYSLYLKRFNQLISDLKLNNKHRPHDTRHTFSTLAKYYQVDDYARKVLMGHKISDITDGTYTHMELDWFRTEIEKIK